MAKKHGRCFGFNTRHAQLGRRPEIEVSSTWHLDVTYTALAPVLEHVPDVTFSAPAPVIKP